MCPWFFVKYAENGGNTMFITDKEELKKYTAPYRLWQGVPGIEVTKNGRIFMTCFSGGVREEIGNFVILIKSDDGKNFSDPIAVCFKENHRCFDSCLWIDPLGRLWFFWADMPDFCVYAVRCDDPDADELVWSKIQYIGNDVMINKPTVLSDGEWMLPITVWKRSLLGDLSSPDEDRRAFVYKSCDNGESFEKVGGVAVKDRDCDEHMILERTDGSLAMYVRTVYGIAVAYSYDKGKSWTDGEDSGLGGPCSRFHIRRLKSGRVLLVNHHQFMGRNNLTAMLSEDEGKTWKYKLLLDGRNLVSYPDSKEADDGYIYISYDRERGCARKSLEEAYADARELLYCRITEEDIIKGSITTEGSFLGRVVSKLDKYAYENEELFRMFKAISYEQERKFGFKK